MPRSGRVSRDRLAGVKLHPFSTGLYEQAERLSALILAACSTVLMTVAAFPSLMAISPDLDDATLAYAEMAVLGGITATIAMLHARHHTAPIRRALFAAATVWWTAALVLFPATPIVDVIGLVAVLACVSSLGVGDETASEVVGSAASLVSLNGRARPHGA